MVPQRHSLSPGTKDKADAILKGSGLEKTSQELQAIGEGTEVAGAAGSHHSEVSGSAVNGNGSLSGSSSGGFVARKLAMEDSQASTETIPQDFKFENRNGGWVKNGCRIGPVLHRNGASAGA